MTRKRKERRERKRSSLQYKLSLSFTLVAIVAIVVVFIFSYTRAERQLRRTVVEDEERLLSQISINIEQTLRSMRNVMEYYSYYVVKSGDVWLDNFRKQTSTIYELNRNDVVSLALFDESGEVVIAEPVSRLKSGVKPQEQEWFKEAFSTIENINISTAYVQDLFDNPEKRHAWVISLSRAVEYSNHGSYSHGVLLLDMDFTSIEQIFKNIEIQDDEYFYLMDQNGSLIYHPRIQLIASGLLEENYRDINEKPDGTHFDEFGGANRMVSIRTVGYTGWRLVSVQPTASPQNSAYATRVYSVYLLIIFVLILAMVNAMISNQIVKPLANLELKVNRIENENWTMPENAKLPPVPGTSREVMHLDRAIGAMLERQEELRERIVREQEKKRFTELDALQAQIHPHFLYNTLDSIIWMIESGRYGGAVNMVSSLARFFRLSLAKGRTVIPLSDELDHATNYLAIQHVRFGSQFDYTVEQQPGIGHYQTIKLIVQPLVENAIYHGVKGLDDEGEINVAAYLAKAEWRDREVRREERVLTPDDFGPDETVLIFIDVADNGFGLTPERIDALLNSEPSKLDTYSGSRGSGVGIANVRTRIKLYFGDEYGLVILSEPDEGCVMRLIIPAQEEPRTGADDIGGDLYGREEA